MNGNSQTATSTPVSVTYGSYDGGVAPDDLSSNLAAQMGSGLDPNATDTTPPPDPNPDPAPYDSAFPLESHVVAGGGGGGGDTFQSRAIAYARFYACVRPNLTLSIPTGCSNPTSSAGYNNTENAPLGNDCTNFVSQSMHYAGWAMTNDWYMHRISNYPHPPGYYFYWTLDWVNVSAFLNWAVVHHNTSWFSTSKSVPDAHAGDVLVLDDSPGDGKLNPGHLMMVTQRFWTGSKWDIRLAAHTNNRRDITWTNLLRLEGSKIEHVWVLHIK